MNALEIFNLISKTLSNEKQTRYLINGDWGIGKSTIIKLLEKKFGNRYRFLNIKAFGVKTHEELYVKIRNRFLRTDNEILKQTFNNLEGFFNKFLKSTIGINVNFLDLIELKLTKNYVLVIDDIERKSSKLNIIEIMGLIEEISANSNYILICNIEKLEDTEKKSILKYLEKMYIELIHLDEIGIGLLKRIAINKIYFLNEIESELAAKVFFDSKQNNLRIFIKFLAILTDLKNALQTNFNELFIMLVLDTYVDYQNHLNDIKGDKKYKFSSQNNEIIISSLYDFIHSKRLDKTLLKTFLAPKYSNQTKIEKAINVISNIHLYNISALTRAINDLLEEIEIAESLDYSISTLSNIFRIIFLSLSKYNLSINEVEVERSFRKCAFLLSKKNEQISEYIDHLNIHTIEFTKELNTDIFTKIRSKFQEILNQKTLEEFKTSFESQKYLVCVNKIVGSEDFFLNTKYIFSSLLNEEISKEFQVLILRYIDIFHEYLIKDNTLSDLRSTDAVIQNRINSCISKLNSFA